MSLTLHNKTDDTLKFRKGMESFHNPPQSIAPGQVVELQYTPGTPTICYYWTSEGQVVVEAGNNWQGNKVFGEGAYRVHEFEGRRGEEYEITKGGGY